MPYNWTDPIGNNPQLTAGYLAGRDDTVPPVYPLRNSGGAGNLGVGRQQWANATQNALSALAKGMQNYRNNQIAKELYAQGATPQQVGGYQQMGQAGVPQQQIVARFLADKAAAVNAANQSHAGSDGSDTVMDDLKYRTALAKTIQAENNAYGNPAAARQAQLDASIRNRTLAKYGMTSGDLANVDFDTPGAVQYKDANGNVVDSATALANPSKYTASGGGLPQSLPLAAYQQMLGMHRQQQASQPQTDNENGPNSTPPNDSSDVSLDPAAQYQAQLSQPQSPDVSGGAPPVSAQGSQSAQVAQGRSQSGAASPDLIARAQQALADPNASAEAKAAAQQILANASGSQ